MIEVAGYRIDGVVGSGSSGKVYRATQLDLGRVVALKVLAPGLFGEAETRARFLREAKLQASLAHPNLLALFVAGFAGASGKQPYLVMEYVEGGSLRDLLVDEGLLEMRRVVRIACEVAAGLEAAHEAGIIHRDLKPENVLFTGQEAVKIADFGLAKSVVAPRTLQTADGIILGTPGYIAPEVIAGGAIDARADLYALGVMLYEMLSGRRPHDAASVGKTIDLQLRGIAVPLSELRHEAAGELETLVMACLAKAPGDRPSSAKEVGERLSAVRDALLDLTREGVPGPVRSGRGSGLAMAARGGVRDRTVVRRAAGPVSVETASMTPPASRETVSIPSALPQASRALTRGRVAAIAAGLLLLLAMAVWRHPPAARIAGVVPLAPPSLPLAPVAAKAVRIRSVTAATRSALVQFDGVTPAGAMLHWRLKGSRGPVQYTKSEGVVERRIVQLKPETDYTIEIAPDGGRTAVDFRTFAEAVSPEGFLLETMGFDAFSSGAGDLRDLVMAANGRRVGLVWRSSMESGSRVRMVRSDDAGSTFGPVETVAATKTLLQTLCLLMLATGEVIVCSEGDPSTPGFAPLPVVYFRESGSAVWRQKRYPAAPISAQPAIATTDGKVISILTFPGPGPHLQRFEPATGRESSQRLGGPMKHYFGKVRMLVVDGHLVVLALEGVYQPASDGDRPMYHRVACFTPEPDGSWQWGRFPEILRRPEGEFVEELEAAASGSTLLIAIGAANRIWLVRSQDGGRHFGPPGPFKDAGDGPSRVSLSSREGRFWLGYTSQEKIGARPGLRLFSSSDGITWAQERRITLPVSMELGALHELVSSPVDSGMAWAIVQRLVGLHVFPPGLSSTAAVPR